MPECWSEQPFPSPGDLPNRGIEPRSPALHMDSLPAEPPGKPKSTGVGSLSLLPWIFPTQKSNRGLLHCRQLSYQGSLPIGKTSQIKVLSFSYILTFLWQYLKSIASSYKKLKVILILVIQLLSHVWLFETPRAVVHQTRFPVLHHLSELAQKSRVSDAIQPSYPLSPASPP